MPSRDDFFNLYRHGFARVAVATPRVRIGDPRHNADATLELMRQAARDKALLAVFPELGLSAYTCDDLFHQRTLIDAAENALAQLLARTRNLPLAALVGLPVAVDGRLYNCAALVCRGRLVGVVPKTYLPNYREFYEARQFTPGDSSPRSAIALAGQDAAFGTNLLFRLAEMPAFVLHVEICEDLWVPAPPPAPPARDSDGLPATRMRQTPFAEGARRHRAGVARFRSVEFSLPLPRGRLPLERRIGRFPYVPGDAASRDLRCEEVYRIQVQGLVTRMQATGTKKLVIGVSGGLDSTQALLVCARALDELKLPRRNILAYTMPGFATTSRTRNQAWQVMRAVGASAEEIDIRPSCMQMLKDIGHPYAKGRKVYDISFENVQAGERTSHLFRLANLHGGFVVGTGDLSELALGWCTYGVGDQMSHYNVNASVPKTLIQYLVGWVAESDEFSADVKRALKRVLDTEISPELVPGKQSTEAIIGPYELQDFNLYYTLRFGYAPAKVAFLAWNAWKGEYRLREIRKWLGVFLKRFFQMSQYKRSAMPSAPKVGSGGSLSPRGDWRAPADGNASAWLADLARVPTQD